MSGWNNPRSARTRAMSAQARAGYSLLEVILALTVLTVAIAMIGEAIRLGMRNAETARELTQGELLCESIMAEITSGIAPMEAADTVPIETDPGWFYTVAIGQASQSGMLSISVTVERESKSSKRGTHFTLTRWVVDPNLLNSATSAAADAAAQ